MKQVPNVKRKKMRTEDFKKAALASVVTSILLAISIASHLPIVGASEPVKVVYEDNFDNYALGTFPPGWGKIYEGRDWSYCRTTNDQSYSSPNSWRLESKIGWSQVVGRRLPGPPDPSIVYDYSNGLSADENAETAEWLKSHPQIWFEVRVKIGDIPPKPWWVDWGLGCVVFYKVLPLWGKSYGGVGFGVDKDTEKPIIGSGGETMPLEFHKWYHIRVCTDLNKRTFCSWVDGKPLAVNAPVDNEGFPEMLKLDVGNIGDYTVGWFDDVKIGYEEVPGFPWLVVIGLLVVVVIAATAIYLWRR